MRLTLRTLLAYLDDTLEPAQARLIGQKVAESDAAQELIARIRQVTRRRRLTTPPATGPGAKLDPNTIAEYLDNELSAEQLALVEETCLGSDVHLAEVAACHQILTLVLGEPAMVPPVAHQRMYGLIQGREAIAYRKPPAAKPAPGLADRVSLSGDGADEALQLGLPRAFASPWYIAAASLLLLATSAGALWMALRPDPVTRIAVAATTLPEPDGSAPTKLPGEEKPAPPPELQPNVQPKPEVKPPAEVKPEVKPVPDVPVGPQPPSDKRVEVGRNALVEGRPSVLLRDTRDEVRRWQRLALESRLFTTDYLLCLPGYRSELRLDSKVHLHLWGILPELAPLPIPIRETAVTLHENAAFDLDFTLERGWVVLANHKPEGEARVRLRFLEEVWDVTLQEPGSTVSVFLISAYDQGVPFSKQPGGEKPAVQVAAVFLEGQSGLKVRGRTFGSLRAPTLFGWDSDGRTQPNPIPLPMAPDWWINKTVPTTVLAKETQKSLNYLADKFTGTVSLEVLLTEMRRSEAPADRALALRCYGALDDLSGLLDALTDEQLDDVRLGAIDVLTFWCGLRPDHDLRLFRLLGTKGISEPQAEIIMQLLHNFSQAQLSSPETYETLIDYLLHDRLPIRELAYRQLRFLVPEGAKKIPYHPTWTNEQRERAHEQWKKLIPTGKLPPRPKPLPGKASS